MHHTFNTLTRFQKWPCDHSNKVTSEVQCTVSAYRVYRLLFVCQFCLHIVFLSCCIVYRVLLFFCTRCGWHSVCQCLLLGRLFSVRLCSSTCIWSVVLVLLRFCSHVVSRLSPCFLYRGFVLIFYVEALSLYYIEALSSYFILRLWPRILFWGFVLIF